MYVILYIRKEENNTCTLSVSYFLNEMCCYDYMYNDITLPTIIFNDRSEKICIVDTRGSS